MTATKLRRSAVTGIDLNFQLFCSGLLVKMKQGTLLAYQRRL
jgi:hypothetical protein